MTKPTHPVELLCCAIATQEGWWVQDSIPQLRRNPGDLDFEGQVGAIPAAKSAFDPAIALFKTNALGVTGLFRQVWLQVAEGQTVRQIINQWDGEDKSYLQDVLQWTGLPADVPVLELLPPLVQLNLPKT
jgi:hypothetical protein